MPAAGFNTVRMPAKTGRHAICAASTWLAKATVCAVLLVSSLSMPASAAPAYDAQSPPPPAQVQPSIVYNSETNTIEVKGPGTVVSLTKISDAFNDQALLERTGPSEWLLKANISMLEQTRLEIHGTAASGDVDWLKLLSQPEGFVSIESSNGQISIRNTKVTSWDATAGAFDNEYLDGSKRAFVSIKNRRSEFTDNRMDVIDSEIAYLGYFEETAYGISWKVISEPGRGDTGVLGRGLTGTVTGSKFHHNYFGLYVWGVGDMVVRNNEFYENYFYGFDAHTVTQRTILEDNFSHDNGGHGIIFADRCTGNEVRRNRTVNNTGHGIMLHESSDNNIIEDNTVTGNDDGIPIFESSNNVIARNVVRDNNVGVRVYGRNTASRDNTFEDNEITGSASYGVYMYDAAVGNAFRNNEIVSNGDAGIYGKSVSEDIFSGNTIQGNEFGIRLDSADVRALSRGNEIRDNVISDSRQYGLYSYGSADANTVEGNQYSGNLLGDTVFLDRKVGPFAGIQIAQSLRLGLVAAIVLVAIVGAVIVFVRTRERRAAK